MIFGTLLLQSNNPSPVGGGLLVLAVVGAIADWRYKRSGGKRPSERDKWIFWSLTGLVLAFFVVLMLMGANGHALGGALVSVAVLLFAIWELGRWRMRRKYPLPVVQNPERSRQ